jgi:hypothetical protein
MKSYRDKTAGFIVHILFPVFIQPLNILVYSHKQANRVPTACRLKAMIQTKAFQISKMSAPWVAKRTDFICTLLN